MRTLCISFIELWESESDGNVAGIQTTPLLCRMSPAGAAKSGAQMKSAFRLCRPGEALQVLSAISWCGTRAILLSRRRCGRVSMTAERPQLRPSINNVATQCLDTKRNKMYIHTNMSVPLLNHDRGNGLFPLACACQNLRRLTRLVTRIYDQELRKADIEITQFGLLTAIGIVGEANQKRLSAGFAMDSTTLTRTLALLRRQGWIHVRHGKDKRERVFRLTEAGKRQLAAAAPYWEAAERRLRKTLGPSGWNRMQATVAQVTNAATEA